MKTIEMKKYLEEHGVTEGGLYTIGGIGEDGAPGIEKIDAEWYNYDCERGAKNNYQKRASEDEACEYVASRVEMLARHYSMWID